MACAGWSGSIELASSSRSWVRAGAEQTELEGFRAILGGVWLGVFWSLERCIGYSARKEVATIEIDELEIKF
jgi:hypothetical protein